MRRGAGGRNLALHVRENTTLWGEASRLVQEGNLQGALDRFSRMDYVTATVCFNVATVHLALGHYEDAIEVRQVILAGATTCGRMILGVEGCGSETESEMFQR